MTPSYYPTRKCYRVQVPAKFSETGKRYPKYFESKTAADDFTAGLLNKRGMLQEVIVNEADRTILEFAKKQLDGGAPDLLRAVDYYKKHFLSVSKTGTMQEMCDAFYAFQVSEGCCQKTLADDRYRLREFVKAFGQFDPRELKPADLFNWVHAFTPGNRSNMFKAAKKLLRWAKRTGYLGIDLMDDMERPESESSKEYLKIADLGRLLRCCAGIDPLPPIPADLKPQYGYKIITDFRPALPVFILGGFAGMRSCELMKVYASDEVVQWDDIKWGKNHIHIRDEVAKQTRRDNDQRFIPLEPAVVAWLKPTAKTSGQVVEFAESAFREYRRQLLARLKITFPINALRNSYASYSYSIRSGREVAKAMGDLEETVRRHYIEGMEPDTGLAWFSIRPEGNKIVAFQSVVAA
jgi:integrase